MRIYICSGTPRQDLPQQVYRDAAMFDDVFDKQGRLLSGRNTVKITSPLTSQKYNRYVRKPYYSEVVVAFIVFGGRVNYVANCIR